MFWVVKKEVPGCGPSVSGTCESIVHISEKSMFVYLDGANQGTLSGALQYYWQLLSSTWFTDTGLFEHNRGSLNAHNSTGQLKCQSAFFYLQNNFKTISYISPRMQQLLHGLFLPRAWKLVLLHRLPVS